MEFFNRIRLKLKIRNLFWAFVSLLAITLFVFSIVNSIKSGSGYFVGIINSKVPIPLWLEICLFVLVGFFFFILFTTSIKSFMRNTEYNELIKTAEKLGNVEQIGETLSAISPSPYAKGELRYNSAYLFYRADSNVYLIDAKSITAIENRVGANFRKTSGTYYVCVKTSTLEIPIRVKKKNIEKLKEDIMQTTGKTFTEQAK